MPLINLPDGNQARFPDDMPLNEIEAVLQRQYPIKGAEPAPAEPNMLQKAANSPIINKINALGGGIQTGLANTIGTAIGSPQTSEALSPPGFVQQSMEENPYTAMAGKGVGYVAPAAALTMATGGATAPLLGRGLINSMAANSIAGSILAGPENRMLGAGLGAATAGIAPVVSNTVNYLVKASTIKTQLHRAVSSISSKLTGTPDKIAAQSQANLWNAADAVENKLFETFRNVPGKVNGGLIASKASQFLNQFDDALTAPQRRVLEDLISNTSKSTNLGMLHDARKALAIDFNKFTKQSVSQSVYKGFKDLASTLDDIMMKSADDLGVGHDYRIANKFHKDTIMPLMDTGAKETADALKDVTKYPMSASKRIDGLIDKYIKPNKPEVATEFLSTLDDVGRQSVEVQTVNNIVKKATMPTGDIDYLRLKEGIKLYQTSLGKSFSPETNKMMTGLSKLVDEATQIGGMTLDLARVGPTSKIYAGLAAAGAVTYASSGAMAAGMGLGLLGVSKLISTKIGQDLLIRAGSEGGKAVGKSIVDAMILQGTLSKMDDEHQANQESE